MSEASGVAGTRLDVLEAPSAASSGRSEVAAARRRFARDRLAAAAVLVLGLALAAALLAPALPLADPDAVDTANRLRPPLAPGHALGTDEFGRDMLSRLVWGTRVSLLAGFGTAALAMLVGVGLGIVGG